MGLSQWLLLRRWLTRSVDWISNGGAGWAVGYALGLVIIRALGGSLVGTAVGYLLFGAIVAALQWPVLRREIPNPVPWVIGSMAGWALGAWLAQAAVGLLFDGRPVRRVWSTAVIAAVTGLVAGGITGGVLLWIVPGPDREAGKEP